MIVGKAVCPRKARKARKYLDRYLSAVRCSVRVFIDATAIKLRVLVSASSASSQAPAWEFSEGSSSFPKHRKLELSGLGFPSWSLGTSAFTAFVLFVSFVDQSPFLE
jgi:hypothetical protein